MARRVLLTANMTIKKTFEAIDVSALAEITGGLGGIERNSTLHPVDWPSPYRVERPSPFRVGAPNPNAVGAWNPNSVQNAGKYAPE